MSDEYIERITSYLHSNGITTFHFEHLAKHSAVIIPYNGRMNRVVFARTGSDWRGPANTVSTVRHVLGLFEQKAPQADASRRVHRKKPLARRQRPVSRPPFSEPAAPPPDKFIGPLMILKARFEAAKIANGGAASAAEGATPFAKPLRIALRTPWLGKQTRYAAI